MLLGQIAVAGAIYGGIRADIRHLTQAVERAHVRIDDIIMEK